MTYQHPQQPGQPDPRYHPYNQPGVYGQPAQQQPPPPAHQPPYPPQPHHGGTQPPGHVYGVPPGPTEQQPPPPKKPAAPPWLVGLTVLLVLGACIGGAVAVFGSSGDDDPVADDNSITAEVMCEGFVEDRLKAPASAEFPDPNTTKQGAQYTVAGAVDSQNSFGAMVRSQYTCIVRDEGDEEGTWTLVNIELGE